MASNYLAAMRSLNRDTRLIVASTAPVYFGAFGITGVLLNLYLLRLGYDPRYIGLINGAGLLAGAAACLPAAAIGRRWGSRLGSIAGLALAAVGGVGLPLSFWLPEAIRPAWLVVSYSLYCLGGWGLYAVNLVPLLISAAGEGRNHAFSLNTAVASAATVLGAMTAGLLPGFLATPLGTAASDPRSYALALVGAPLSSALAALLLLPTAKDRMVGGARPDERTNERAPVGVILAMTLVLLVVFAGVSCVSTFYNVYLDAALGVPTARIGTIVALGNLVGVPVALLAPLALGRWGNRKTYAGSYLGVAVAFVSMALVAHWEMAALAYLVFMTLTVLARPGISVLQMMVVTPRWRTTMSAAGTMAITLGYAALAFGGGQIIAALGYRTLFLTGAGLILVSVVFFWAYFGRRSREVPAVSPA